MPLIDPPDVLALKAKLASLDAVGAVLRRDHRRLLLLDTRGERALAAVAVGDVDTARHVAVFTPGLRTTVDDSLTGYDERLDALRLTSRQVLERVGRSDESVAMVTWIGYEAPQARIEQGIGPAAYDVLADDDRVISADSAQRGGDALRSFLQGIEAARTDDPHLTALGHSYGSLTTGHALRDAAGVDDVVLFGSPGADLHHPADLHAPSGHAYYLEAPDDAIRHAKHLPRFGVDPSHLDRFTHLDTGAVPTRPDLRPAHGHSEYLDDDTTSQHNMAAVVVGVPHLLLQRPSPHPTPSSETP